MDSHPSAYLRNSLCFISCDIYIFFIRIWHLIMQFYSICIFFVLNVDTTIYFPEPACLILRSRMHETMWTRLCSCWAAGTAATILKLALRLTRSVTIEPPPPPPHLPSENCYQKYTHSVPPLELVIRCNRRNQTGNFMQATSLTETGK